MDADLVVRQGRLLCKRTSPVFARRKKSSVVRDTFSDITNKGGERNKTNVNQRWMCLYF